MRVDQRVQRPAGEASAVECLSCSQRMHACNAGGRDAALLRTLPRMCNRICSVTFMMAYALRRGPLERLQQSIERQLGVHARGRLAGVVQRFYPQCRACSDRQAAAVKLDRRTLVTHFSGFRPPYAAGMHLALM